MSFISNILKPRSEQDEKFLATIRKLLGFRPNDLKYYRKAFTHSSVKKKTEKGIPLNYERLEFLGDAILSSTIALYLFKEIPAGSEGDLTQLRSKIVSREHLNEIGRDLALINLIDSNVPKKNFGDNVHGNMFESLVGAVYIDKGHEACQKFINRTVIEPYVDIERLEGKITSYKSVLIEWCQKVKKHINYEVYEDTGNDTIKHFSVKLFVDNKILAKGRATSKKKAEEIASKRAYFRLQDVISL
ncbi:ribonuclease III [Aureibaculum sp. A20]|uniref:Ribonuclease 3 n=1 Tax=Aureibaculum flavum TaxID=2795986 RepID=A0ABS0WW05_9FLAO|nr:ribonuclease III [Aureibaculum flavum]MBJ2176169.1 ribonuclease III [Aureibaculum flavum]